MAKLMFHYINKEKNNSPTLVADRIKELISDYNTFEFCDLLQTENANGLINLKLIEKLKKQIKIENPDVVILSGIASAFHAAIACKMCKVKKIVLITHGIDSLNPERNRIKRLIFKYIIEPVTILLCTDIQCNSEFVYNYSVVKIFGKGKRQIIYNPLPIRKKIKRTKAKDKFIVISASRIIENKGYDILLETIKNINNKNILFYIIGDGEYLPILKKELSDKDNVILTGKLKNDKLLQILSSGNLFVLPSKLYETFGLVYLEAALFSIPSVCGNRGAVTEMINNNNGFILENYSSEELTNIINYSFYNKNLVIEKGIKANNEIKKKYSNSLIRKKLIKMYGEK